MDKFIKNIGLFLLYTIILLFIVILLYKYKTGFTLNDLPAPNLSNSYSLNDKMLFSRNKKADILAIGSSMGLNNLYSETIVNRFRSHSYLNLSSWGLSMKDIFLFIKMYSSIHKPFFIVIASNYPDYQSLDKKVNYDELRNYLTDHGSNFDYYLKHLNFQYYYSDISFQRLAKSSNNFYESLLYDKYGAVLFDPYNFKINNARWNSTRWSNIREDAYWYTDSISNYCKRNNIKLFFFESAFRDGIAPNYNKRDIEKHISRIRKIFSKNGQIFIDSNEQIWPNNLYVDAIHFNSTGAKLFTEYCFDKVEQLNYLLP